MSKKFITFYLHQQSDCKLEINFDDNKPMRLSNYRSPLGNGDGLSQVQLLCAEVVS